jgi:hypothetical protein
MMEKENISLEDNIISNFVCENMNEYKTGVLCPFICSTCGHVFALSSFGFSIFFNSYSKS